MEAIFIHGLGQDPSSWDRTLAALTTVGKIRCPDLFALLSDMDKTYENLYRAFSSYCMQTEEPLNLCGLSLGAVLALDYAACHPEKVRSLALIGAQYQMPKVLLAVQNLFFRLMPKAAFQQTGLKKDEMICLTRSMRKLDFSGDLKAICCPTAVICGEKDAANKKASLELSQRIPGAALYLVENAGHELNREAPQRLAEILDSFYSAL